MGNSLRSNNPIAKLNAYPLIFTFSKPCSEVTSATHTPAQKGVRKGAPLFSRIFAGREESSRQMQDFKRRRKGHVTGEKELYRVRKAMELEEAGTAACSAAGAVLVISNSAPFSTFFEICICLRGGASLWMRTENSTYLEFPGLRNWSQIHTPVLHEYVLK